MKNKEILEQILLDIDDKRHLIHEMQNFPLSYLIGLMDNIYSKYVPYDIQKKVNFNFGDKTLVKIFDESGLKAIRDALKAAINKAKDERIQ